jgi:hypothetical protein
MFRLDLLPGLVASAALTRADLATTRRSLILAPLLSALPALLVTSMHAGTIFRMRSDDLRGCLDLHQKAQMATLYGDLDKPGPQRRQS